MILTRRPGEQTFSERYTNVVELVFERTGVWRWSCDWHGQPERAFDSRDAAMRSAVAHICSH